MGQRASIVWFTVPASWHADGDDLARLEMCGFTVPRGRGEAAFGPTAGCFRTPVSVAQERAAGDEEG